MERELKMEMLREVGLRIAGKMEKATGIKTEVAVTSSDKILFHCYCCNNDFDYAILKVDYEENRSDLSYLKEILEKTESEDYYIYQVGALEKQVIKYIEKFKISNAWVYEGELNIDVKGYTLDPIDLKYYSYCNFEINNGKLELAIKYEDDYEIFIEHIFDSLYVTEYDGEGNECCIYCHEAECDCLESNLEKDDKCYCAELSESLMCANQEIEELKAKIINLQKEKLEMLDVLKKLNEREMKRLGLVE